MAEFEQLTPADPGCRSAAGCHQHMTALDRLVSPFLEKHCYGLAGLPRYAIDQCLQNEIDTFVGCKIPVEPSDSRGCAARAPGAFGIASSTRRLTTSRSSEMHTCDQNRDRKNRNGTFVPRSSFPYSFTSGSRRQSLRKKNPPP